MCVVASFPSNRSWPHRRRTLVRVPLVALLSLVLALAVLALATLGGCKESRPPVVTDEATLAAELQQWEWRRQDPGRFVLAALRDTRPRIRVRAIRALGRIGGIEGPAVAAFKAALADPSPAVRAEAAFALGSMVLEMPMALAPPLHSELLRLLRTRTGLESAAEVRAALGWSLAWIGESNDTAVLSSLLGAGPTTKGETAPPLVLAWGISAGRHRSKDPAGLARVVALLQSPQAELRAGAAWALWRAGAVELTPGLRARLSRQLREDPNPAVRRWLTERVGQTLPQQPRRAQRMLLAAMEDVAPEVRSAAARALGASSTWSAMMLSRALQRLWREVGMSHQRLTGPQLRPILVGLRALECHAHASTINHFAEQMVELSDASNAAVRYVGPEALSVDLVNCAAARLWDLGRRRVERSATCGTARAVELDPAWRRAHVVAVIRAMDREPSWKLITLRRYLNDPLPEIRALALRALAGVQAPDTEAAIATALRDKDLGVLHAAAHSVSRLKLSDSSGALATALATRLAALSPSTDPEPTCALVEALAHLGARAHLPILARLYQRPPRLVRRCAGAALLALGGKLPQEQLGSRGLPDLRWAGEGSERALPQQAILVTAKGELIFELAPQRAPAAVAQFARLAASGAYRGTRITIPGADGTIEAGATRLDGTVTSQLALPSELSLKPFRRGSLGFVTAGPDGAAQRFFICRDREPLRDGRHTHFGQLVGGYEVLDRLQGGERIKDLYIPKTPRRQPTSRP